MGGDRQAPRRVQRWSLNHHLPVMGNEGEELLRPHRVQRWRQQPPLAWATPNPRRVQRWRRATLDKRGLGPRRVQHGAKRPFVAYLSLSR